MLAMMVLTLAALAVTPETAERSLREDSRVAVATAR
jgi:hypothetical protein